MKKILVPTDFSDTAKCALGYARHLAELWPDAAIDVVHLYLPATAAEYPNIVAPVPELIKAREDSLKLFLQESEADCAGQVAVKIPVNAELRIGFPADEIVAESSNYDLIVMGTTGENDLLDNLFGSVSSLVARKASCPVILVPRLVEFSPINHILFASNYESAEDKMLDKLIAFNESFKATVHFVHVREEKDQSYSRTMEDIFQDLFRKGEPSFAFEMDEVVGESISDALNTYSEEKHIDLVVMVARKRSFWDNFFHRSQTKRMALNTKLPLMVLHC
ncbi:MAG: universal stress protein [Lewinellaceae bacterium]|nr:universal stress protein [Lewinellaceae bacterium]